MRVPRTSRSEVQGFINRIKECVVFEDVTYCLNNDNSCLLGGKWIKNQNQICI